MTQDPSQPTPPSTGTTPPASKTQTWVAVVLGVLLALTAIVAIGLVVNRPATDDLAAAAKAAKAAAKADDKGPGKGAITIKSISGSDLTIGTEDGWNRTISATSTIVITKGGQTIKVTDLKVGDEVDFDQDKNADGSYTIIKIEVPTPKAGGEVTNVDGNNITVKDKDEKTQVITVTDSTVYKLGPNDGTKSDVKVGVSISAHGTVSGDTFTATEVKVKLPKLGGEVTAKTADTITVKQKDGTTGTIHVTSSTKYSVKDVDAATLANITVGGKAEAEGSLRADGSIDAVAVKGTPPKAPKAS